MQCGSERTPSAQRLLDLISDLMMIFSHSHIITSTGINFLIYLKSIKKARGHIKILLYEYG